MQYGFVIDQETCIGCHACTTACKAENGVPLGSFRTWVKYVEKGTYPQVKRHFLVQRCNQCAKPPCVDICPVGALSKGANGIVDVDRELCIGCRACMQACPYDALYLNEDLGAVEKCHFCAHRVEVGLAPACVNVCPVGAIIPGDFDDPDSRVSLIRSAQLLTARRTEQGTGPNVFYIGAEATALEPGSAERPDMYLWSQRPDSKPEAWPADLPPIQDAREVLNTEHKVEWGWPVALYLVTKGIAGGIAMLAPFLGSMELAGSVPWWYPEAVSLAFTIITVFLLVEDLKKPWHFYKLFTQPNWKSWLVKGGIVLTAFGAVTALILVIGWFAQSSQTGQTGPTSLTALAVNLRWVNFVLGAATAGYTAFLFAQCKGRDLWESKWLLPHLLVQAVLCGCAVLLPFAQGEHSIKVLFLIALAAHFGFVAHEVSRHETPNARQASGFLKTVSFGSVPALTASAILLIAAAIGSFFWPLGACFAVLAGLHCYEHGFVRAGQLPPLS